MKHIFEYLIGGKKTGSSNLKGNIEDIPEVKDLADLKKGDRIYVYKKYRGKEYLWNTFVTKSSPGGTALIINFRCPNGEDMRQLFIGDEKNRIFYEKRVSDDVDVITTSTNLLYSNFGISKKLQSVYVQ